MAPQRGKRPRYPFGRFAAIRRFFDLEFLGNEHVVYATNISGQYNLWAQPLAENAWPVQLTAFEERSVRSIFASRDGSKVALFADRQGTENFQVYLVEGLEGWPKPLTRNEKVRHEWGIEAFHPQGTRLAFSSNERDPRDMDLWIYDLKAGAKKRFSEGAYITGGLWSPGGDRLTALEFRTTTDAHVHLLDVATGKKENLTQWEEEALHIPGPWTADGRGFFLLSDRGSEFLGLAYYDMEGDGFRWVERPSWDVEAVDLSRDGRFLAWTVNEDGYNRMYVRDRQTGKVHGLSLPGGQLLFLTFSPDARYLGFAMSSPRRPNAPYLLDWRADRLLRLFDPFIGRIPEEHMVEPDLVRFESLDGRQIPAFLFRPHGATAEARAPAVLSIHGGPEYQERPVYIYSGLYQVLTNHGIGVLAPNIRGSTGYGKTYQKFIHRDWGGGELRDIEAAAQYLQSLDWVDPERLGIFGGSFGGFATLSAVTRLPAYWRAAVDIVGPSNLITFAKTVPEHWKRFMDRLLGDPEKDHDLLVERSPITYVSQVTAALLVIQGAHDPRVVQAESDQMVERLKAKGLPVEYIVYEDEGHGFTKRKNELSAWRATVEFLEKHLLGLPA
ncbi:MAG: prolyl oligopeptidase family serine peptidase [Thermoplasmata archaeon]